MIKDNEQFRFDIMDMGDDIEIAYQAKLEREEKKRIEKVVRLAMNIKNKTEECGECEGCGCKKALLRWVHNDEAYVCYECFEHDLDCESSVMVPMHRVTEMPGYMTEDEWYETWEEEQMEKFRRG